ncbi:unnamed protein product [Pelagomonas calceolata]|uniref:Fe2OG dioxygenase domain-containing protein n=1 Tax=Pelagomonas calceolata TaxID=35677 RepID=A0A8J2WV79_9STRA|nr:unnamed protein product [Pelagomonas calceolata]
MRCTTARIGLAMLLLAHAASGAWRHAITAITLTSTLRPARGEWQAKGKMEFLWATPVMEYDGLFNEEQLCMFAKDVLEAWDAFQAAGQKDRVTNPTDTAWTQADLDRYNEKFFAWQSVTPVPMRTLETVWQAFVFAVREYVKQAEMPPLLYQRPNDAGTAIEWTTIDQHPNVQRGNGYCWAAVQANATHHDVHTHAGSSVAGTLYLSVPGDGGALSLNDPRGPMPPFDVTYRKAPRAGNLVIFPATLPHGVLPTFGSEPRISISCNHPGHWQNFTNGKVVFGEKTWETTMLTPEEHRARAAASKPEL